MASDEPEEGKHRSQPIRIWLKIQERVRPWIGQLVTLLILILYTVGGAYTFVALEGAAETERIHRVWELKEGFIREMFKRSKGMTQAGWHSEYLEWLLEFRDDLCGTDAWGAEAEHDGAWTFQGSLQFCLATYLTIGYGNLAPVTATGRIFCIMYALLGIPLAIYMLKTYGTMLTLIMQHAWTVFLRFYYMGKCWGRTIVDPPPILNANRAGWIINAMTLSHGNRTTAQRVGWSRMDYDYSKLLQRIEKYKHEFELPLLLSLLLVSTFIVCGAIYIMKQVELDWGAEKTFYYLFITLFTVGFGDVVVTAENVGMNIYIFIGMVIMSMLIDVVQMKGHKLMIATQRQLQKSNKTASQVSV